MEAITGEHPLTCPWQAMSEPIVQIAVDAYPFFEKGQLALLWGTRPPRLYIEAVGFYHRTLHRILVHDQEQRIKEMEKQRGY